MTHQKTDVLSWLCRTTYANVPLCGTQSFRLLMKLLTIPSDYRKALYCHSAKSPKDGDISRWLTTAKWMVMSSVFFYLPSSAYATEVTRPAYTPPPPAVSSGSIMQIIFSLLLVLAAIVLVAWLLKRMNVAQQSSVHLLKVLGGVSIGQRERIVLVEIKDTWLVVGVGPGQIRTLHTLPKAENPVADLHPPKNQPPENKFASLLSSVLSHRKQGTENK